MAINIIAGFLIGVFQQGVPFEEALKTYTILTVGDGLVSILPSLLVSVAGGIVVTRAASKESLGVNVSKQLFNSPRLFWIAGGALTALGLIPGLPKISFFSLAAILMYSAYKMKPQVIKDEVEELDLLSKTASPGVVGVPAADPMDAILKLDELMLEVGMGLVPLVDAKQGGQLLARVKSMARTSPSSSVSWFLPSTLPTTFAEGPGICDLFARGRARALGAAPRLPAGHQLQCRCSRPTRPGYSRAGLRCARKMDLSQTQGQAIAAGYAVVDPTSVLAAHLAEVIRQMPMNSCRGTKPEGGRQADEVHPKLADELIPKLMSLGEVQKVLQQLLREQVSIRDLGTILETLVDAASFNKNPIALVEAVRHTLGRALIRPLLNDKGELRSSRWTRRLKKNAPADQTCNRTRRPPFPNS